MYTQKGKKQAINKEMKKKKYLQKVSSRQKIKWRSQITTANVLKKTDRASNQSPQNWKVVPFNEQGIINCHQVYFGKCC